MEETDEHLDGTRHQDRARAQRTLVGHFLRCVSSVRSIPAFLPKVDVRPLAARRAAIRGWARLFPGPFAAAGVALVAFLAVSTATRVGLALFNGEAAAFVPWRFAGWLAIGAAYDIAVGAFWLLPFAVAAWLWPAQRARRALGVVFMALGAVAATVLVFSSMSEFVFWNEFASRFNFIAVDYLIYTREVIGNIRESYPMTPILLGLAALALLVLVATTRGLRRAAAPTAMTFARRSAWMAAYALVAALSFVGVPDRWKEFADSVQAQQLAGNGIWEFFHAFNTNEIDYDRFYATLPELQIADELREEFREAHRHDEYTGNEAMPIERRIVAAGPEKRLNVVLISVESLSAEYMGHFGSARGLTPRLDRLADEGLLFTQMYATGTRTVRGLEALALSLPPTPGHSVVKRPNNENLFTIGEVFAEKGYDSLFIYGGYGYFDNMGHFFGSNGYRVVDRTALASADVHYENIWGVADEDLFTLALRELDAEHADGKRFFAHVMTTSNHRPYTYPAGRVDVAPGTSAEGAVKYTDWALGDFIDRARTRPWFDDTLFVIVADHCAASRGKTDLPLERFHIPMIVYAPRHVAPARIDSIASQIDVPPTILALLNFSYVSRFFGQDILTDNRHHPRALMANYQTIGHLEDGMLVELRPQRRVRVLDAATGREVPMTPEARHMADESIAYYQAASEAFRSGALRMPGKLLPRPFAGSTRVR
jgi:phosphoglycerol transferase MdoB-like AlkP superfamily enzyme